MTCAHLRSDSGEGRKTVEADVVRRQVNIPDAVQRIAVQRQALQDPGQGSAARAECDRLCDFHSTLAVLLPTFTTCLFPTTRRLFCPSGSNSS